jgi:hypothetical protein
MKPYRTELALGLVLAVLFAAFWAWPDMLAATPRIGLKRLH